MSLFNERSVSKILKENRIYGFAAIKASEF